MEMGSMAIKRETTVTDGAKGNSETTTPSLVGVPSAKVLDLSEACDLLGIAKVTMYGYLKKGIIPAFKYPRSRVWKFDRAELEKWLKDQQTKGGNK